MRGCAPTHHAHKRAQGARNKAVALIVWLLIAGGCSGNRALEQSGAASNVRQSGFRIRADMSAPLNTDSGWAGNTDESVRVPADQPFRVRIELELADNAHALGPLRLQVRRNGAAWRNVPAADFPYPDEIESPRVSIVSTPAYVAGAPAEDLLRASRLPFSGGAGIVLDSLTAAWHGTRAHGEWEWPVVIRRFADSAVTNNTGDEFEFRMADASGRTFDSGMAAKVTLVVAKRLLGGTFVETPGRLGPWQAKNGDLYFVMEPAETWNVLMMVTSRDGGDSWAEADGAHRPVADDLEGFATARHGARIHMLHQTSHDVWYHVFRTSDDPAAPDTWAIRDERVAAPGEPPTQVADLAVRSDGSVVAVYGASDGLRYRIRSPNGVWGSEVTIDGHALSGPQTVLGRDDVVHIAYTGSYASGGRAVYARRIQADGTLGTAALITSGIGTAEEDVGAVLPLLFLDAADAVVIIYRLATGELWERRINDARMSDTARVTSRGVAQSAVDSDQVGADAIVADNELHVLFIDAGSGEIYHTRSNAPGQWTTPTRVVAGTNAQWVRGARVVRKDGAPAYGFVYDAGSDGGSGMNRYAEVPLRRK